MGEVSSSIKPKFALSIVIGMFVLSIALAVHHTFFEQDYIAAMVCIYSTSAMFFLLRNPKILMAKSWAEFDELFHNARDKKYLWGFPAYHLLMLSAILYIYFV
jgi:hypothetical protein